MKIVCNRIFSAALVLALALSLFGCGRQETTPALTGEKSVTVTVLVDCTAAVEYGKTDLPKDGIWVNETLTLAEGSSAMDALEQALAPQNLALKNGGGYVQAIGDLGQGDCGGESGWMYQINGTDPTVSAEKCTLSQGDTLRFYYITSYQW